MNEFLVYTLAAIVTLILWNVIHEMSHIVAAKFFGDLKEWSVKPYPHTHYGNFRFAGAYWTWDGNPPSNKKRAIINSAPRIADFIASQLICLLFFMSGWAQIFLAFFCMGAMVDQIVGSIGWSPSSDMRKSAEFLDVNPWWMRIPGLISGAVGAVVIVIALV